MEVVNQRKGTSHGQDCASKTPLRSQVKKIIEEILEWEQIVHARNRAHQEGMPTQGQLGEINAPLKYGPTKLPIYF